jgi:hypothetical protein
MSEQTLNFQLFTLQSKEMMFESIIRDQSTLTGIWFFFAESEDESDESDSEDEDELEDDNDSEGEGGREPLDLDMCPTGLSQDLYDQVCQLREKRLDLGKLLFVLVIEPQWNSGNIFFCFVKRGSPG